MKGIRTTWYGGEQGYVDQFDEWRGSGFHRYEADFVNNDVEVEGDYPLRARLALDVHPRYSRAKSGVLAGRQLLRSCRWALKGYIHVYRSEVKIAEGKTDSIASAMRQADTALLSAYPAAMRDVFRAYYQRANAYSVMTDGETFMSIFNSYTSDLRVLWYGLFLLTPYVEDRYHKPLFVRNIGGCTCTGSPRPEDVPTRGIRTWG